jgi:hypothetical protein
LCPVVNNPLKKRPLRGGTENKKIGEETTRRREIRGKKT